MLKVFNEDYSEFGSNSAGYAKRTTHNGTTGGADEFLVLLRNDDPSNYYTDLLVTYINSGGDDGAFGSSGWSVKLIPGTRRPTQKEWDTTVESESIQLEDIGNNEAADTYSYHGFWVRVFSPGNIKAQLRESQSLKIYYTELKVGG